MPDQEQPQQVYQQQPQKSNTGKYLVIGCVVSIVGLFACCIATFCLLSLAPTYFMQMFVSDAPLDIEVSEKWSESEISTLKVRLESELASGEPVTVTAEEVTQLVIEEENEVELFKIAINQSNQTVVYMSFEAEEGTGQYINIFAVADIEIEDGEFRDILVEELTIGDFDMGVFLKGQDLSYDVNADIQRNAIQNGQENPIEFIKYFAVEDGEFKIEVDPDFFEELDSDPYYQ